MNAKEYLNNTRYEIDDCLNCRILLGLNISGTVEEFVKVFEKDFAVFGTKNPFPLSWGKREIAVEIREKTAGTSLLSFDVVVSLDSTPIYGDVACAGSREFFDGDIKKEAVMIMVESLSNEVFKSTIASRLFRNEYLE